MKGFLIFIFAVISLSTQASSTDIYVKVQNNETCKLDSNCFNENYEEVQESILAGSLCYLGDVNNVQSVLSQYAEVDEYDYQQLKSENNVTTIAFYNAKDLYESIDTDTNETQALEFITVNAHSIFEVKKCEIQIN